MWQMFTERARKAVYYAQEEAKELGENMVSSETAKDRVQD